MDESMIISVCDLIRCADQELLLDPSDEQFYCGELKDFGMFLAHRKFSMELIRRVLGLTVYVPNVERYESSLDAIEQVDEMSGYMESFVIRVFQELGWDADVEDLTDAFAGATDGGDEDLDKIMEGVDETFFEEDDDCRVKIADGISGLLDYSDSITGVYVFIVKNKRLGSLIERSKQDEALYQSCDFQTILHNIRNFRNVRMWLEHGSDSCVSNGSFCYYSLYWDGSQDIVSNTNMMDLGILLEAAQINLCMDRLEKQFGSTVQDVA